MISCVRPTFRLIEKKDTASKRPQELFAEQLALEVAGELTQLLQFQRTGVVDLESVEVALKSTALRFGAAVLSAWINADCR